ncbi:MAG: LOG family protein [Candidatus Gastranaerophilales bacterium]|nr:LOG family protein [Candidatus Gastranaerophilales bacterium]
MRISPVTSNYYRPSFKANYSKENNVTILGSSKLTDSLMQSLIQCSELARYTALSGKNVLTGCGSKGIMGQAYYTAAAFSKKDETGKPEHNLVILKDPMWGDEDLDNCHVIDIASSEAERIEKFMEKSDSFVIFPGGPGTMQEATTLISNNYYNKDNAKHVYLVGSKFFKGLDEQYHKMYKSGLIKCHPSKLYTITDDIYRVIDELDCGL